MRPLLVPPLLFAVLATLGPVATLAQEPSRTSLGAIEIVVGAATTDGRMGYSFTDSYGTLASGEFPAALFQDETARTVSEIWEDQDLDWHFAYTGGADSQWVDDVDLLSIIAVRVTYEDGRDTREFMLESVVSGASGTSGWDLSPALPARDWEHRDGETVEIEFLRVSAPAPSPGSSGVKVGPVDGEAGSFVDLLSDTPGGPVVVQLMITAGVALTALLAARGPQGVYLCLGALVLTPWVPAVFGFGSLILSTILTILVLAGASAYRVLARPVR